MFAAAHALPFSLAPRSYSFGATKPAAKSLLETESWAVPVAVLVCTWRNRDAAPAHLLLEV